MDKKRKRFPLIRFTSAVLVCMVMLMATIGIVGNQRKNTSDSKKHVTLSKRTLQDICRGVDFADTCIQNLPFKLFNNNEHSPRDFLKLGFESAMNNLRGATQTVISLQMEHGDQYTKNALTACSNLADKAISDLQRSLEHFLNHDINSLSDILDDLLTWVSGSLTCQQTCLDGFLHANGVEVGPVQERMRTALSKGMEFTINALGTTSQLADKFSGATDGSAGGSTGGSTGTSNDDSTSKDAKTSGQGRRLKSLERFPEGLDSRRRALLEGGPPANVKPDVIVAQDGSGKYKTINEALKDIPLNGVKLFVLYIKAGIYNEKVTFNIAMTHVMVIGDGPTKTKITGAQNVIDGTTTFLSATVGISNLLTRIFVNPKLNVQQTKLE